MRRTPNTQHWLPTRSHKIPKIKFWLTKMRRLPNVAVRYSSDKIDQFNKRVHGSVVATEKWLLPWHHRDVTICEAYTRGGKCGDCRACWDKSIKTIAYPAHGATMLKKIAA